MIPNFIRTRYSRKFAVIGLVVILVVSGIGWVTQAQVSENVTDVTKTVVQTNAELEAESLGQWLQGQKQQIRSLSNDGYMQSGEATTVRPNLERELAQLPAEIVALHYVQRESRTIVASSNQSLEGKVADTDQSIEEPLETGSVFWNPNTGFTFDGEDDVLESWVYKEGEQPSVALASPVPNSNHAVVAIIRTNLRAERFSSSIEGTRTVAIGGFTGLVLFSENKSDILTQYGGETNTTLEQRVLDPNVSNTGSLNTDENVVGYASVPSTDWVIVKEAPKSNALVLQREVQQNLLVLIGAALLGLLALNLVTAWGPMRSLRQLARQGEAIAAGDLSTDIEEEGRIDEVGRVRDSFRDIKTNLDTATAQSDAIAKQQFDYPVLDEKVPGSLGESLQRTGDDLETFIDDLETARNQAEVARIDAEQKNEQLQVIDRLLRHNLKNDLNIVRLHAETIIQDATTRTASNQGEASATQQKMRGKQVEHAEIVVRTVDGILEKTTKQRLIMQVLLSDRSEARTDIGPFLEQRMRSLSQSHPNAEITLDVPESATVMKPSYFEDAVTELLENAILHCDHGSPEVVITVTDNGSTAELRIADNGSGIPSSDKQILFGDRETDQLNHGTGIGLWLVYWVIQQSSGQIRYETNEPRGSVIILELPTGTDGNR